jgi:GAF domain-containing protein
MPISTDTPAQEPFPADYEALKIRIRRARPHLERVLHVAAHAFDAGAAVVSLSGNDEISFVVRHGAPHFSLPYRVAFCSHVIDSGAMLVIENAASDPVHGQNPLVKDMPFLRFYAGAPFTAPDGRVLGAVAVIDTEPRFRFSEGDREALAHLAAIASHLAFS